jgi:hypothetical protein
VTTPESTTEDVFVVYQSALPLSRQTITMVADLLRARLKRIGSRWRKLPPGRIATIVLAVLRHDQRLADMAGGNGVSPSTIRRWVWEVVELLSARAPRLDRVLRKISRKGGQVVLLDGTLIRTRRRTGPDNRRNYSGKHKAHGLLILGITDTRGNLVWVSAARPGRSSEITTTRHNRICEHLRDHDLAALADLGFIGLDNGPEAADRPAVITGKKASRSKPLTRAQKQVNQLIAAERAVCEHGFAYLKAWRILTKLRLDPARATHLLRALLVLTSHHITR